MALPSGKKCCLAVFKCVSHPDHELVESEGELDSEMDTSGPLYEEPIVWGSEEEAPGTIIKRQRAIFAVQAK